MTITSKLSVTMGRGTIFGETSSAVGGSRTTRRTNAKFLLACGIQLLTLAVMFTRVVWNHFIL
jgi:hypothetical protein